MSDEFFEIGVEGSGPVSAVYSKPEEPRADLLFAYAPGAGSSLADPFGAYLADQLRQQGLASLRFQFPYMQAGRSLPDRNAVLEATWLAAIEAARELAGRVAVGGRSMGGRIASQVVAQGAEVAGLALFAYPLHPPGRPEQTRDWHLGSIMVPTLFCSGTRDSFASPAELEAAGAAVPTPTFHFIVGADHGFNVRKSSGITRGDVWHEACAILVSFLRSLTG